MNTTRSTTALARFRSPGLALGMILLLTAWVVFLRWPTFAAPLWNVDEGIHAAVARTLLDGGVLYHDAVDQRTPLTYYAVALLFRVCGENNLWALRAAVALIIAATALGLHLIGRRTQNAAAGIWAAVILCALTTNLFYPGDGNAVDTEWFVILFTTWGTWWFWRTLPRTDFRATVPTGMLFGLAFLSKQPGMLDLAAPLLTLLYLSATGAQRLGATVRSAAGILLGFLAVTGATLAYFALRGAFGDLVFYTWTYNLLYYGPDVGLSERLLSIFIPVPLLFTQYPLVLVGLVGALAAHLFRLVQLRPTAEEKAGRPWACYLLVWSASSLAAAISGGRGFEHYFIQCLPAFTLSTGWLFATAGSFVRQRWLGLGQSSARVNLAAVVTALLLGAVGLSLIIRPLASRGHDEYPRDPAARSSRFIKALTTPDEHIFVWGYNPDIYLYADRKPASRFVYCSFQTGMIPWTNIAPGRDTAYAIVPGAMDTLLADLNARRPGFVVDCSAGPHRHFSKYPPEKFGAFQTFVSQNYLETESAQFVPQGFRLHLIKDRARLAPVRLAGGTAGRPEVPQIFGPPLAGPVPTAYLIEGEDPDHRLQRLELRVGDTVIDSASFQPFGKITVRFEIPFNVLGPGQYRLVARAISANGATRDSAVLTVACAASAVRREQLPAFGLPCVTTTLLPLTVRAPFAPSVEQEDGHRVISLHAPSLLSYALSNDARLVRGSFGIRPGAYATSNPSPTDGAEFAVEWVSSREEHHVVFHRWLQPRDHPGDRPPQIFTADIPPHPPGGRLEFVITPGPNGNNASDWTFWSDLQVETSR